MIGFEFWGLFNPHSIAFRFYHGPKEDPALFYTVNVRLLLLGLARRTTGVAHSQVFSINSHATGWGKDKGSREKIIRTYRWRYNTFKKVGHLQPLTADVLSPKSLWTNFSGIRTEKSLKYIWMGGSNQSQYGSPGFTKLLPRLHASLKDRKSSQIRSKHAETSAKTSDLLNMVHSQLNLESKTKNTPSWTPQLKKS